MAQPPRRNGLPPCTHHHPHLPKVVLFLLKKPNWRCSLAMQISKHEHALSLLTLTLLHKLTPSLIVPKRTPEPYHASGVVVRAHVTLSHDATDGASRFSGVVEGDA